MVCLLIKATFFGHPDECNNALIVVLALLSLGTQHTTRSLTHMPDFTNKNSSPLSSRPVVHAACICVYIASPVKNGYYNYRLTEITRERERERGREGEGKSNGH